MQSRTKWAIPCVAVAVAVAAFGCSKEEGATEATAKASAAAAPTTPPAATTAAPTPPPPPPEPKVECPKDTSGEGTLDKPCMATGSARAMEVTWTGKQDDKGPSFRVVNKTESVILFGKIAVYFYDKAGKQLDVPLAPNADPAAKAKRYHTCSGNMFGGVMKAGEKAVITFSCVKAKHVPEGTKFIEAEMQTVGFTDDEKKITYYLRNDDLVGDERPKGGMKAAKPGKAAKKG